ncbi:MAG: CPBP family intramembrane metalloprotease [Phycisphaerae bacterium]|nr:CPBP family intramembrane metalloprotease [Phycisphaerae bacterium]
MLNTRDEPPAARPIARPLSYAAPAPNAIEASYPIVAMPRSRAAVDVAAMLCVFAVAHVFLGFSGLTTRLTELWPLFGMFSTNILLGVTTLGAIWAVLTLRGQSLATIGLNRAPIGRVVVAAIVAVPACYLAGAITNMLYITASGFDVEEFFEERTEFLAAIPDIPLAWALLVSIFVGVHEEVFFRGFLLSRLRTICRSDAAAIVLTSAVFGSLHFYQGLAGVFQTAVVGAVMAIVVTYARTLWPAILAHAVFDTIGIVVAPILSEAIERFEMGS